MPNRADRSTRYPRRHRAALRGAPPAPPVLLALALLLGAFPGSGAAPLAAQEATAEAAPRAAESDLRAQIEESYEVLPTASGLLLRPLEEYRGVRSLEITGSELAINGEIVSREAARGWLGERADAVLRLADLPAAERERLFRNARAAVRAAGATEESAEDSTGTRVEAPEIPEPPEPPELPERPRRPRIRRGSQTVVGSTVRIERDEVSDDIVVFGGAVVVQGRVEGNVTVFGGNVDVDGEVTRDVTAIGGNVRLGEDAEVGGDATSVGGRVRRAPGARVRGSIEEVDQGWNWARHAPFAGRDWWGGWNRPHWSPWGWMWNVAWPLAGVLFVALLMMLVIALGRPTVERLGTNAGIEPVKSGVVGLLVAVLIIPVLIIVSVLLAISIIGIPILIVLLLLFVFVGVPGLLIAGLVGYTAVAWRLGRWSEGRFGWRLESPYMAALVGLVFLYGLEVIGKALDFGPLTPFSVMFLAIAAIAQFVAGCVGFGAVFMMLYERRQRRRAGALVPPPPPGAPLPPAEPTGPAGAGDEPPPPDGPPEEGDDEGKSG